MEEKIHYERNQDFSNYETDIKPIALYLPQFHEIPENNAWWGEGFTEWTNVKKAKPRFDGHYQPRVPDETLGYYDLTDVETLRKQATLAKEHGIYAFGVYYYWFSGKRLLEKPIDILLAHPEIDFPFFLIWVNENWTRSWDGQNSSVLIGQEYSDDDPKKFIRDIQRYVDDPRYMKVDGKPVIGVYNPAEIPHTADVLAVWRKTASDLGVGDIQIWSCVTDTNAEDAGISSLVDAEYEFPPRGKGYVSYEVTKDNDILWDYGELVESAKRYCVDNNHPVYRGSMLSWDNSARRQHNYHAWKGYTHQLFYLWNRIIVNYTRLNFPVDKRFIFINAWNEWGEGTYLEPDQKYGFAGINALSKAIFDLPYNENTPFLINGGFYKEPGWDKSLNCGANVAVQIHLFYLDLIPEIFQKLANIQHPFDLYVTTNTEFKSEYFKLKFSQAHILHHCVRSLHVDICNNRGRDVIPFLNQMRPVFNRYKYICHIHTKKSKYSNMGDLWRNYLFDSLLGSQLVVDDVLYLMETDNSVGMVYPDTFQELKPCMEWGSNRENVIHLSAKMGINLEIKERDGIEKLRFPCGDMFWARTEAVRQILEYDISEEDIPDENGQIDGTIMHAIERMWSYVAEYNGFQTIQTENSLYTNDRSGDLVVSSQENENLKLEIKQLKLEVESNKIALQNVLVSKSWQITTPLRSFTERLRSNRSIRFVVKGVKYLLRNGIRATWQKVKAVGGIKPVLRRIFNRKPVDSRKPLRNADDISFAGLVACANSNGATVFLPERIKEYETENKRKILLISHELDLTGAPVVLRNFAISLLRNGDLPIIVSPHTGKLNQTIVDNCIPVIVFDGVYSTEFVRKFASLFDVVIVNTIVGSPVINMLANTQTPVLWWIHEAETSYHEEILKQLPNVQPGNVSIYCGGSYAEKVLLRHRPSFKPKQMLYYTVDMEPNASSDSPVQKDDRILFAMVGTMQERKGPDILADAILHLPEEIRSQSRFIFIGRPVDGFVVDKVKAVCQHYPDHVEHWDEIPYDQLLALYQDVDCLICPSRDDPMPCTITEVLLLSVPVICSENCGYAPLITKMECGRVFSDNDPVKLAAEITNMVNNRNGLQNMRAQARRTYETFFSESVFDSNSQTAISDTIARSDKSIEKSVSVVIPTYNAGEEGRRLFKLLREQEGLDTLDIIVVDSGSKDDTVEIARQFCCKVIQIPNEEFSHSYARNLGAKNASTNYVLFMTQDAVPTSADWINKMVSAIQEHGAVAASCCEIPKPDCDLYGIVCCFNHNRYMDIMDHDRILRNPALKTAENIRLNAQINDIACVVLRDVFLQYQFRGNYAEDLDLGRRMISDRHQLMLLSSSPVIHSHTRSAIYHFRRAIVDMIAIKRIIPEQPVSATSALQAYNQMLTCAFITFHSIDALQGHFTETISLKRFRKIMNGVFSKAEATAKGVTKKSITECLRHGIPYDDGGMLKLVEEILAASPDVQFDPTAFYSIKNYILIEIVDYFKYIGAEITPQDIQNIADAMLKRLGSAMGSVLAAYSMTVKEKDKALESMIQKYSHGI